MYFFAVSTALYMTCGIHLHAGCTDNLDGAMYSHGDSWNPVFSGYGRAECVNCTCMVSYMLHSTISGILHCNTVFIIICRTAASIVSQIQHALTCHSVDPMNPFQILSSAVSNANRVSDSCLVRVFSGQTARN